MLSSNITVENGHLYFGGQDTVALAQQYGIEMPITECIYKVIHGEMDARYAVPYLMERGMKNEMNIF